MGEAQEALRQVRRAHLGRLAAQAALARAGEGGARARGGALPHRLARPVLAVRPAGWRERMGEERATAEAVVDRIAYCSAMIAIEGAESMRKRMAWQA